jgi:hypothetical protein
MAIKADQGAKNIPTLSISRPYVQNIPEIGILV